MLFFDEVQNLFRKLSEPGGAVIGVMVVMIADGWRCMNPLRLAALDASPFCEAKGGGMVVGAAGFGRVITYGSG